MVIFTLVRIYQVMLLDTENFEKTFWNYYLELEQNFLEIDKLIPFDKVNYLTFSYKYVDLLSAICSEIDVLFKKYIKIKNYTPDLDEHGKPMYNINQYLKFVESKVPNFKDQEIDCYNPRFYNKKVYPFSSWSNKPPKWWTVNNKIKHNKEINLYGKKAYKNANQICVLNALSALFQLNLYVYKELKKDDEDELKVPLYESQLFRLENWGDYYKYIVNGRNVAIIADDLLDLILRSLNND